MPRVIKPTIGKVVGPLGMKIAPTASITNCKTRNPNNEDSNGPFTSSSNLDIRRGRYSRKLKDLKKNQSTRSTTLSSPKETSFLFGKPLEDESSFHGRPPDSEPSMKKSNVYKSQELNGEYSKSDFSTVNFAALYNKCTSNNSLDEPSQRHALAIDTRYLVTSSNSENESPSTVKCMIRHVNDFTKSLHTRGITPCIITSTTTANTNIRSSSIQSKHENKHVAAALADLGLGIKTDKMLVGCDDTLLRKVADSTLYSQVDIPSTKLKDDTFSVPLPLNAAFSWMVFAAMVDAIMTEDAKFTGFVSSKSLKKSRSPINATIICSDVSLFCDTNVDSHKTGLQTFIDHVGAYFHEGLLSSVDIITAITHGHIELCMKEHDSLYAAPGITSDEDATFGTKVQENHQKAMQKCVSMIEWTIDELMNGFQASNDESTALSFCCSFLMIKNSHADFNALSHSLVRKELIGRNAQLSCHLRHIDLPVSNDGTHCSLSLEASYEIFPFLVQSLQTNMLSSDLHDLSKMQLEVVQLIPLSVLDVSLLFGVPIVVRAGLEQDYAQFQEMKVLVRSLFRVLQKQEQAILLRGSSFSNVQKRTTVSAHGDRMDRRQFGSSYLSEQYFVLMAQEIPITILNNENSTASPNSGLLLRIAHTDQLLHDKYMMDSMHGKYDCTDDDHDTEIQYMEHIENSLTTLSLSSYNPFTNFSVLHNGETSKPNATGSSTSECEGVEGNINTTTDFDIKEKTLDDVSTLHPRFENSCISNEMEISNNTTKLSIYDLHAEVDDIMDDVTTTHH